MRLLLTGATGQVGWELARTLLPLGTVVIADRARCDLAQPRTLGAYVDEVRPDVIVNPAAYTAVDKAEDEPAQAMTVNADAVGELANAARRHGALFVHYSTDYVFDGSKDGPYRESDSTGPLGAYGRSKLAGERAVSASGADHVIFRTSWVYAARGKNFLRTMLRLAGEREQLRVVADQCGTPTWARLIAETTAMAVQQDLARRRERLFASEVVNLTASGSTSWHGFASAIVSAARELRVPLKCREVVPIAATDYPLPAPRPANSRLAGARLAQRYGFEMPAWEWCMHLCLAECEAVAREQAAPGDTTGVIKKSSTSGFDLREGARMKAMILAAGKGTRVQPLTYELPKPMIPVLGKPVLEYLIEHLQRYGVREIMINVSYLNDKIEKYFGDGRRFGVEIGYSFEGAVENGGVVPRPVGSAGGIRKIQDFSGFFDETTVVLCGDALIDLDLTSALHEHRRRGAQASLVAKEVRPDQVSDYGIVVMDTDGRITSFQEKPKPADALSNWANTGIYIFEPEVIDLIPSGRSFDIGSELFPLLVKQGRPFFAQRRFFNWIDIGKVTDYWVVLQKVMQGEVADFKIPGRQIREDVWAGLNTRIDWNGTTIQGPVYFGSGCEVEAGATIVGPTWIGHGSRICAGGKVTRSVLFEYTCVPPASDLRDTIVCGNYAVDRAGRSVRMDQATGPQIWCDARAEFPFAAALETMKEPLRAAS
jgi:mannose-1-phosphate guanylyltransferase